MAENKEQKSLEMRVAELEDKLSKIHITEDEMKAFHKVSSLLGTTSTPTSAVPIPAAGCIVDCVGGCITECTRACTILRHCTVLRFCTIIRQQCFECGGGCAPGGGFSGAGFGSLGG